MENWHPRKVSKSNSRGTRPYAKWTCHESNWDVACKDRLSNSPKCQFAKQVFWPVDLKSGSFARIGAFFLRLPQRSAESDAAFAEVVGRNGHGDDVAGQDADEVFAHTAGDVGDDFVPIVELDAKLRVRQGLRHFALSQVCFFFRHAPDTPRNEISKGHRMHRFLIWPGELPCEGVACLPKAPPSFIFRAAHPLRKPAHASRVHHDRCFLRLTVGDLAARARCRQSVRGCRKGGRLG